MRSVLKWRETVEELKGEGGGLCSEKWGGCCGLDGLGMWGGMRGLGHWTKEWREEGWRVGRVAEQGCWGWDFFFFLRLLT